jgi:hypothetical protein
MKNSYANHILVVVAVLLAAATCAAGNMLSNASFEVQGSTGLKAAYWEWGNPDLHGDCWGTASRESWRAHGGGQEGTIRGSWAGGVDGGWWQEKPAEPGVTYTLSAWFWADGSWTNQSNQGMKLEFFSGSSENVGPMVSAVTNLIAGIDQSWTQKQFSAVAPTNAAWVRAVVFASAISAYGSLQFDDVSLIEEPGSVIEMSQVQTLPLAMLPRIPGLKDFFSNNHRRP